MISASPGLNVGTMLDDCTLSKRSCRSIISPSAIPPTRSVIKQAVLALISSRQTIFMLVTYGYATEGEVDIVQRSAAATDGIGRHRYL